MLSPLNCYWRKSLSAKNSVNVSLHRLFLQNFYPTLYFWDSIFRRFCYYSTMLGGVI